jgi:hypothetical protein
LEPVPLADNGPCGLWVATDRVDFIFYESGTTQFHQEHIVAHELGHLLCGHQAGGAHEQDLRKLMLPSLDPRMVDSALSRTNYSTFEEQEAEYLASLILQITHGHGAEPTWDVPPGSVDVMQRVDRSLRHPPRSPR